MKSKTYPNFYPNNFEQVWNISAPQGIEVMLITSLFRFDCLCKYTSPFIERWRQGHRSDFQYNVELNGSMEMAD